LAYHPPQELINQDSGNIVYNQVLNSNQQPFFDRNLVSLPPKRIRTKISKINII